MAMGFELDAARAQQQQAQWLKVIAEQLVRIGDLLEDQVRAQGHLSEQDLLDFAETGRGVEIADHIDDCGYCSSKLQRLQRGVVDSGER